MRATDSLEPKEVNIVDNGGNPQSAEHLCQLMKEYFDEMDTNGSGTLDRGELEAASNKPNRTQSFYNNTAAFALKEFDVVKRMAESRGDRWGDAHPYKYSVGWSGTTGYSAHSRLLQDLDYWRSDAPDLDNVITKQDLIALQTVSSPQKIEAFIQDLRNEETSTAWKEIPFGLGATALATLGVVGVFFGECAGLAFLPGFMLGPGYLFDGITDARHTNSDLLRRELNDRSKMLSSWKFE